MGSSVVVVVGPGVTVFVGFAFKGVSVVGTSVGVKVKVGDILIGAGVAGPGRHDANRVIIIRNQENRDMA